MLTIGTCFWKAIQNTHIPDHLITQQNGTNAFNLVALLKNQAITTWNMKVKLLSKHKNICFIFGFWTCHFTVLPYAKLWGWYTKREENSSSRGGYKRPSILEAIFIDIPVGFNKNIYQKNQLPKTNLAPARKIGSLSKRKVVFQPSMFRCELFSFKEGRPST